MKLSPEAPLLLPLLLGEGRGEGFLAYPVPIPCGTRAKPLPLDGGFGMGVGFAASFRTRKYTFAGMTEFHKDLLMEVGLYRFGEGFANFAAGRGDDCFPRRAELSSQNRDRYSSSSKAPARLRIVQYAWSARCTIVFSRLRSTFSPSAECAPAVCTMASGRPTVSATCTP